MTAPFEVPKPWQTAMSMVSINAGLFPQQVLQHYYKLYPLQVAAHPQYTELDVWRSRRAKDRGIRALRVHHADADPSRIYLVFILLDELDPFTKQPVLRLITNTSIRHVLEEPCSNCPLWLPVRVVTTTAPGVNDNNHKTEAAAAAAAAGGTEFNPSLPDTSTPYQIIPCCEDWAASADFDAPMSDEEKKVPQLVDRLIEEMRRKSALLIAKDEEIAKLLLQQSQAQEQLQQQEDEKKGAGGGGAATAAAMAAGMAAQQVHAAFDAEALVQYWWAGAAFVIFCVVLLLR